VQGNIIDKNVVKSFKNLGALQSLLTRYVVRIGGDDAGIVRPDKTDYIVELNPSVEQHDITELIREYVESCPDSKQYLGAMLHYLNALYQTTLSLALVDRFVFLNSGG
jgi:hypothetical protein